MVMQQVPSASKSVAVLPFQNETGDPGNEYLADGMSDGVIARISNYPGIRVVPRASSFKYKSVSADARAAGSELGVDSVLAGRLLRFEEGYKVELEMISVSDGRRLFAMDLADKADRVFALQDAISDKIIDALQLTNSGPTPTAKTHTVNNEAFQCYLKGEYDRQKGTPAAALESIEMYKKAIQIDPEYALAHLGLALAYRSAPAYGILPPQEAYPQVKLNAYRALELDPSQSNAYVALAAVKSTFDWDFAGAEQEYKRALQLSPNSVEAHFGYGNFLVAMGRTEEALTEFRNALQADPLSLNVMINIGWALYVAGRHDEAEAQVRMVIERDATFARAYLTLGEILEEKGRYDEAIQALQNIRQLSQDPIADMALGHVFAVSGRRAEAQRMASDLEEKARAKQVSAFLPGVVYAGMNEKDRAFYWLERAYQERSNWLLLVRVGRRLNNLHGDPRFDDLVNRIGFPK
jgi:TolB-like protein/Tfp pilus assembly protein PilF